VEKLRAVIENIKNVDESKKMRTQERLDNLTKPQGSLGSLEEISKQVVAITDQDNPRLDRKAIFVMAADHGVCEDSVSAYPQEVTKQMVLNFLRGGAGINVLARHAGVKVIVTDMGVASTFDPHPDLRIKKVSPGTKNMAKGPAMTRKEAVTSIENGIDVFEEVFSTGIDLVGTGDMGIGNTTPSSAIASVITGSDVKSVTGRGTGIDEKQLEHKIAVIERAILVNKPDRADGLDVLSKVGGFEIGGLVGVILGAASRRVPVVIDGFISGAAALLSCTIEPKVKEYMIAAHSSVERGHRFMLDHIGLRPILNLDLRLGEGTGACLAFSIIEASMKILDERATFESAAVSKKEGDCVKSV